MLGLRKWIGWGAERRQLALQSNEASRRTNRGRVGTSTCLSSSSWDIINDQPANCLCKPFHKPVSTALHCRFEEIAMQEAFPLKHRSDFFSIVRFRTVKCILYIWPVSPLDDFILWRLPRVDLWRTDDNFPFLLSKKDRCHFTTLVTNRPNYLMDSLEISS